MNFLFHYAIAGGFLFDLEVPFAGGVGFGVGVGAVFDRPLVGRGEGDGVGGFAVVAADDEGLILVIDDQGEGGDLRAVYQIAGRMNAWIWASIKASFLASMGHPQLFAILPILESRGKVLR